jgi:hypothetical protein
MKLKTGEELELWMHQDEEVAIERYVLEGKVFDEVGPLLRHYLKKHGMIATRGMRKSFVSYEIHAAPNLHDFVVWVLDLLGAGGTWASRPLTIVSLREFETVVQPADRLSALANLLNRAGAGELTKEDYDVYS